MVTMGEQGCECIDQSAKLESLSPERSCTTPLGNAGVILAVDGSCAEFSYGSGSCLQHDLVHDVICQQAYSNAIVPAYCFQPWCFVDRDNCGKNSEQKLYASDEFPYSGIYYSYSTCHGTSQFWQEYKSGSTNSTLGPNILGGITLRAAVPSLQLPNHYKLDAERNFVLDKFDLYYNNKSPFHGIYIDYVEDIIKISNGDISKVEFTYTSKGSQREHPSSSYTASVQDIQDGLVDMGVAPFWITDRRLMMASYTVPLVYDKTFLVIPKPGTLWTLQSETSKVLDPFTWQLWLVVMGVILTSAGLGVWFTDHEKVARQQYGQSVRSLREDFRASGAGLKQKPTGKRLSKAAFCRLALDGILEKGLYFFSAGVEKDPSTSLPHKLLMFGFGFFILIAVSAYVANLAAFLTRPRRARVPVKDMETAVATSAVICAHPGLEETLVKKWPTAKFNFDRSGNGFPGVLDLYKAGGCDVLAFGWEDSSVNRNLMDQLCDEGLVFTDSLVIEVPIAFPMSPKLASGFSYWMFQAEKYHGISISSRSAQYLKAHPPKCNIQFDESDVEDVGDFAQVSPTNMILPIMFFLLFAFMAIILHCIFERERNMGKRESLLGRQSNLSLFKDKTSKTYFESMKKRTKGILRRQRAGFWAETNQGFPTQDVKGSGKGDNPNERYYNDQEAAKMHDTGVMWGELSQLSFGLESVSENLESSRSDSSSDRLDGNDNQLQTCTTAHVSC